MAVDGRLLPAVLLLSSLGCAGAPGPRAPSAVRATEATERFPLAVCAHPVHPEATGVWQDSRRDVVFAYDGCSVRFVDELTREPAIFAGQRNVARSFVIDVRDYGDPPPYYRTRARWDGERLQSVSILGLRTLAVWRNDRFWRGLPWSPFFRARAAEDLGPAARALTLVERYLPTEDELAQRAGVEMPPDDGLPRDFIRGIMCPTGECDDREEGPP